ncbi:MAG: glucose-6-phosphate dehydrogenase [Bacteroidota bacterium]
MINRIILFGATGDLTRRLWLPAVAQLAADGILPDRFRIVGSALEDLSTEGFQSQMTDALAEHAAFVDAEVRGRVVDCLSYQAANVTDPQEVKAVLGDDHEPTLVYLALPTFLLEKAFLALGKANMTTKDALAIEKPFGNDLTSAQKLNEILHFELPHPSIFRIDHFLSDELVRRILTIRFANRLFQPVLNSQHVDHVDISWLESLALEGRAGYYDKAGALKDMIQNHMIEALSLLLMEEPARFDEPSFRGNRVEALRSIATPTLASIKEGTVRAQYSAGTIGDRPIPDYVAEPGVDPSRETETYAAVDLEVPNSRWEGTRFTLRSGKAMPANSAEITIHFKPVYGFENNERVLTRPNVLRIGLMEPYVRAEINIKGPDQELEPQVLEMMSPVPKRTAYANLIAEMLRNNTMLFIRDDEVEETWRVIDPIVEAWQKGEVPLQTYAAGTDAPTVK